MLEEVLQRILRAVFGGGSDISAANPLEVHDPKVGSLISYEGTTTDNGTPGGTSLVCSDLAAPAHPDYDGNLVIITSGAYAGQARDINGATNNVTGTVTPASAFGGQIVSGVTFTIVGIRTVPAEVAAIEAKLDNGTHGLAALKVLIDAVETKADVLGLTTFTQETHAAVDANGTNWVDLLDKSTITKPTKICGFKVTVSAGWAGKARVRITDGAGTTKIFPFQAYYEQDTDFTSATQAIFNFEVVVPVADGYKVQFCSSAAGDVGAGFDVTLDNLDIEEIG